MCGASGIHDHPNACFDSGLTAGWRGTIRSHEQYLAEMAAAGQRPAILLKEALGIRLECTMIDVLHTVDQGIASHIIANVCLVLILREVWGTRARSKIPNK